MAEPDSSGRWPDSPASTDFKQLVEGLSGHAVFTVDPDGRISSWSGPAAALYGYERDAAVGRPLVELVDNPAAAGADGLDAAADGAVELDGWHRRADGSVFWASMTVAPLGGDAGEGYSVISEDTTARRQHGQTLERQNDRLKEFIDVLSHDLRNPLNLIDGRLELLRETGEVEHIDSIEETTARMERLVEDLLSVARHGRVVSEPSRVRLEEVVATAWEGTGATAPDAGVTYEAVPPISGEPDRLCALFENLFRNAVEHGGAAVTVRVGPLDHGFFVEDDGPGIPPDRREAAFDHGVTMSETGNGYGLSIVRTIVNAHGWDVHVTASSSGGARFEITGIEFLS